MAYRIRKKKLIYIIPLVLVVAGILFSTIGFSKNIEVKGSTSNSTAFVTRMYQQCLDRQPDEAGLYSWVNQLNKGNLTGADLGKSLVASPEFQGKNLNNTEFVSVLYRAFLGRNADTAGLNKWTGILANGQSRIQVLAEFINSSEFKNICNGYGINPGSLEVNGNTNVYGTNETDANTQNQQLPAGANLNGYEQQILNQINNTRVSRGLNPLTPDQALTNVARQRSGDMLSRNYFSHYTPEGTTVFNLLRGNGVSYQNAGENLAHAKPASAGSVGAFMNAWMNSPTHAANILRGVYNKIGIGLAENSGRRVVTTVFSN